MTNHQNDPVLRAKYRDYCSARVADAILAIPPDEIYALAEGDSGATGESSPRSYGHAIRLATGKVRERLGLPDFEEWAPQYIAHPERFDPYLMGGWARKDNSRE